MTTIHMETEKVRAVGKKLDTDGAQMLSSLHQTQSAASRLNFAWHGGTAEDFNHDLNRLIKKIENQIMVLQTLSVRVCREVDEWLAADRFETSQLRGGKSWLHNTFSLDDSSDWLSPFRIGKFILSGIGFAILDGAHAMFGVARDQFNRQIALGKDAVNRAIQYSDELLDDGFTGLLGNPQNGNSESITLEIKGDVSIPGIEVGVPGSFKLESAREVTITKENGKYKLVLSNGGGAGMEEPLLPGGEGKLKIGRRTYEVGIDGTAEALAKGEVEVTYEFDPNKPGDMTKMAAFMYGIGIMDSPAAPLVAPTLVALKDNLSGIKIGAGVEGSAKVDASVLTKLAGVKSESQAMMGGELRRDGGGHWESVQQTEIKLDSEASLLTNELGGELTAKYETITHPDGSQSVKVIVDIKTEVGKEFALKNLEKIAPPLKDIGLSGDKYQSVKMEFTVDAPVETARKMIEGPGINWKELSDNSDLVIYEKTGREMGLGASGKVQVPTQKIGVGAEVNVERESSHEIYRSQ